MADLSKIKRTPAPAPRVEAPQGKLYDSYDKPSDAGLIQLAIVARKRHGGHDGNTTTTWRRGWLEGYLAALEDVREAEDVAWDSSDGPE